MGGLLWGIVVVLFVLWFAGSLRHVGGSRIHLLLIAIGILVAINFLSGRASA